MEKVQLSRKKSEEDQYYIENEINHVVHFASPDELSGTLRKVTYIYNLASEVINGGYGQYFENKRDFDQNEVIVALEYFGFIEHSKLFQRAFKLNSEIDSMIERGEAESERFDILAEELDQLSFEHYNLPDLIIALYDQIYKERESELIEWVD